MNNAILLTRRTPAGRPQSSHTLFPFLFLLASLIPLLTGCAGNNESDSTATTSSFEIPELKDRSPGLDATDFRIVQERDQKFRTALTANPSDVKSLIGLAQVFSYEARVTGDHPYYYPAAMLLVDRALSIEPDRYEGVVTKASILLSLHKFSEAREVAEQAARLAPMAAAPYGALVDANVELGDYPKAVAAADRMMQIRPDLKSYARVSYLREIHGDLDGAIEAMELAVGAGAPGSEEKAWAQKTLGDLYIAAGNLKKADDIFTIASIERNDYPFALAGRARVAEARGQHDSALALLDQALELIPEFSFVEMKADIYRSLAQNSKADSLVTLLATMLAEDEASGHDIDRELAMIYADHNVNLSEALRRAEAELARRPENIDAEHTMAYVLFRSGRVDEALTLIRKANRTGSKNPLLVAHTALIERAAGVADASVRLNEARTMRTSLSPLLQKELLGASI